MMLTSAGPGSFEGFYGSHSLVGELRACGFHTLWISNQGRRGEYDSFSTSMAREADDQIFLNDWSWKDTQLDGKIVDELDARGVYRKTGQATFIHLIGSHTDYKKRVPAGFGFPNASDVVTQYDNTILYTDHVLSELYRRFAGGPVLMIYASDHGQMVSQSHYGSGFLPGYQEEFRTPLLIWTEDKTAVQSIRDAIGDSRLNLESFDDVVRYLVGMSPLPRLSTRQSVSILRPDYVRNYDELATLPDD
jgi:heptose-I-phosphate ethanolaminephosphotransferase